MFEIRQRQGHNSQSLKEQVIRALGPPFCIPAILGLEARSVISPRGGIINSPDLVWSLAGRKEILARTKAPTTQMRRAVHSVVLRAFRFDSQVPNGEFADELRACTENFLHVIGIKVGDVVRASCYRPNDIEFHVPFVMHRSMAKIPAVFPQGSMLWYVMTAMKLNYADGQSRFWLAVRQCVPTKDVPNSRTMELHFRKYVTRGDISLLKMDEHVQECGVIHDSDNSMWSEYSSNGTVSDSGISCPESQRRFFILCSETGYPPRQG